MQAPSLHLMNVVRQSGLILAALELAPAARSDVTAILLSSADRSVLFGCDRGSSGAGTGLSSGATCESQAASPLAYYLAENVDHDRINYWTSVVSQGVGEGRFCAVPVISPYYPSRLREVWDAPPLLFFSAADACESAASEAQPSTVGLPWASDLNPGPTSVAIIGSRKTTGQVIDTTERLAAELSNSGATVISGLASGVDAAAHRGALEADGRTIAVVGTGVDLVYPAENLELADRIRAHGAIISQFAPQSPPTKTSFLVRNHVIVALGDVCLIMDGAERSGSRYAVEQAITYGRPAFAWAPTLGRRQWVRDLVRRGGLRLVESAGEVREFLASSHGESRE